MTKAPFFHSQFQETPGENILHIMQKRLLTFIRADKVIILKGWATGLYRTTGEYFNGHPVLKQVQ